MKGFTRLWVGYPPFLGFVGANKKFLLGWVAPPLSGSPKEALNGASRGKTFVLPVVGLYSDGVTRPIRLPATGTSYKTSDERVVTVYPMGLIQLMGSGRATVTAENSGIEGTLDVLIDVSDEPNEPPEADAGPDQKVRAGRRVLLNGINSLDPEGGGLRYYWSQVRGAKVPLLDLNMMKASFQAPDVSEPKLFRFSLRVTDKKEADSFPDHVDVIVKP